jgi:hypothetical protein
MSEWSTLWFVAATLYVTECLVWVRSNQVLFYQALPRSDWRVVSGQTLFGNDSGGFALISPLRVDTVGFVAGHSCVRTSPEGVCASDKNSATSVFIPFSEMKSVSASLGDIYVNRRKFAATGSTAGARDIASRIQQLRSASATEREAINHRQLSAALQRTEAAKVLACVMSLARPLRRVAMALVLVFCSAPLAFSLAGPYPTVWVLMGAVLAISGLGANTFARQHRVLYPKDRFDRVMTALTLILFPPAIGRAVQRLSREALVAFHPIAIAHAVCDAETARSFFCRELFDLRRLTHDLANDVHTPASECVRWSIATEIVAIEHEVGCGMEAILSAPAPRNESMVGYCERCQSQFAFDVRHCPSCPGSENVLPFNGECRQPPNAVA